MIYKILGEEPNIIVADEEYMMAHYPDGNYVLDERPELEPEPVPEDNT
jgi:hypothetical protein